MIISNKINIPVMEYSYSRLLASKIQLSAMEGRVLIALAFYKDFDGTKMMDLKTFFRNLFELNKRNIVLVKKPLNKLIETNTITLEKGSRDILNSKIGDVHITNAIIDNLKRKNYYRPHSSARTKQRIQVIFPLVNFKSIDRKIIGDGEELKNWTKDYDKNFKRGQIDVFAIAEGELKMNSNQTLVSENVDLQQEKEYPIDFKVKINEDFSIIPTTVSSNELMDLWEAGNLEIDWIDFLDSHLAIAPDQLRESSFAPKLSNLVTYKDSEKIIDCESINVNNKEYYIWNKPVKITKKSIEFTTKSQTIKVKNLMMKQVVEWDDFYAEMIQEKHWKNISDKLKKGAAEYIVKNNLIKNKFDWLLEIEALKFVPAKTFIGWNYNDIKKLPLEIINEVHTLDSKE